MFRVSDFRAFRISSSWEKRRHKGGSRRKATPATTWRSRATMYFAHRENTGQRPVEGRPPGRPKYAVAQEHDPPPRQRRGDNTGEARGGTASVPSEKAVPKLRKSYHTKAQRHEGRNPNEGGVRLTMFYMVNLSPHSSFCISNFSFFSVFFVPWCEIFPSPPGYRVLF